MHEKKIKAKASFEPVFAMVAFGCVFCMMTFLSCVQLSYSQSIKASIISSSLNHTSLSQWIHDLGYKATDLSSLAIDSTGCPFIEVNVSGVKVSLLLDTGMARGFGITNHAPMVPHSVEAPSEQLNPDGSHMGESVNIRVDRITVLGRVFTNVFGHLYDSEMFSSVAFNGAVGLDFFLDRRLTLDYKARKVGVSTAPLPAKLDPTRYITLDLIDPPARQGHILYVRAQVNKREAIIYLDTGYNVSFIDPSFTEGLARIERPGKFRVFRNAVPIRLVGQTFILDNLREKPIERGTGFDLPVALELGSDILSRLFVTIDVRSEKMVIALATGVGPS